jgi:serine/threonine protein kinase
LAGAALTDQPYEVQKAYHEIQQERRDADEDDHNDEDSNDFNRLPVGAAADIFCLGMMMGEIVSRQKPFQNHHIFNSDMTEIPKTVPTLDKDKFEPWLAHLLTKMLLHERKNRPTIEDVLAHPHFMSWRIQKDMIQSMKDCLFPSQRHPTATETFRFWKRLLLPFEQKLNWPEKQRELQESFGEIFRTVRFPPPNMETNDLHPLPNVASAAKWFRNAYSHVQDELHREELVILMTNYGYKNVDELFSRHPSLNFFLLEVWECRVIYAKQLQIQQAEEDDRHEAALAELEQDGRRLDDIFRA